MPADLPSPVALHEAGHYTVARLLGHKFLAATSRPGTVDGERVGGYCWHDECHSRLETCAIAAAGGVAVTCAGIIAGCHPTPCQALSQISSGDWESVNEDPDNPSDEFLHATKLVFDLFSDPDVWGDVITTARTLDDIGWVFSDDARAKVEEQMGKELPV